MSEFGIGFTHTCGIGYAYTLPPMSNYWPYTYLATHTWRHVRMSNLCPTIGHTSWHTWRQTRALRPGVKGQGGANPTKYLRTSSDRLVNSLPGSPAECPLRTGVEGESETETVSPLPAVGVPWTGFVRRTSPRSAAVQAFWHLSYTFHSFCCHLNRVV